MSEFRQNPLNHTWVLMAPNRAKRPEDFRGQGVMKGEAETDIKCVFCPGNESVNAEVMRYPDDKSWQVRLIENKYHALGDTPAARNRNFYTSMAGFGDHEVLITRKHNEPVALQSVSVIELSLKTLADRQMQLYEDPRVFYVQAFHNHGRDAGASLVHPHYQLLALPMVPGHIHEEILGAYHYFERSRVCIYCDIMNTERVLGERLVLETSRFMVISAFASRKPFETWIIPKNHEAGFEDIGPQSLRELATVLKWLLERLYVKLSDPPLNFYLHTMPAKRHKHTAYEEKSYHWHLTVFPRLTIWGGFEYAAGIPINPMLPEDTARFLRE